MRPDFGAFKKSEEMKSSQTSTPSLDDADIGE